ncbi:MAG: four helix bundle protein [Bacteroidota bacterium]|jgi:four helix bundle protein
MHRYKDLSVWQKAMDLVVEIYKITKEFPSHERFGLISQMNRCAISIPSTIAEGAGRNTAKDFDHFLAISLGSSFELYTQLVLSNRLGYVAVEVFEKLELELAHIQNMVVKLKKSLNS